MISIDKEQTCLLELIKASLFNLQPNNPDNVNWERVLELAKLQCVVPLITSLVPLEYSDEWLKVLYQSKAHFMQMLYEQDSLVSLLKEHNIPLIIFKGVAASVYFPNPSLRTYGDIDFYVFKENLASALVVLEQNGYKFISNDERQYVFEKNGVEFELHSKFSSKHYNNIEHIIINGMENAVEYRITGYSFPGLPKYENGVVLLGHIMQHLKSSGIGLRQIIDWMMFVHAELDDLAWQEHFRTLAIEAGLDRLAVTVTFMCRKWMGLPNNITWCNNADEEVADQLLIRILDDGNFGHDRAPYENLKRHINNEGFFTHLQNTGIENWRLAKKYKILRPFAWLYQLCKYAYQGVFRFFSGEKVFQKDKQLINLEELWKKLE